jgi:hypothetical protein
MKTIALIAFLAASQAFAAYQPKTVVSAAAYQRVERVITSGTCATGTCTISAQTGSWVSSITRSGTGQYTVNFTAGTFSAAPVCSWTGTQIPVLGTATTSALSINSFGISGGSLVAADSQVGVICVGTK